MHGSHFACVLNLNGIHRSRIYLFDVEKDPYSFSCREFFQNPYGEAGKTVYLLPSLVYA